MGGCSFSRGRGRKKHLGLTATLSAPGYLADDCPPDAPGYLADDSPPDARVRQLRSADTRSLVISRMCSSFGDRTFAAAGPQVWNNLPPNLRLRWLLAACTLVVVGHARCSSHRTRDHRWPCVQCNCSSCVEQFANGSAVF